MSVTKYRAIRTVKKPWEIIKNHSRISSKTDKFHATNIKKPDNLTRCQDKNAISHQPKSLY